MAVPRQLKTLVFACAIVAALLAVAATAQQPDAAQARTIYVTVVSEHGEYVRNLKPEAFAVSAGERAAGIASFSDADVPTTVGILFDASASMKPEGGAKSRERIRQALRRLFWAAKSTDEFFLVAFNDRPQLLLRDTGDEATVLSAIDRVAAAKSQGKTALFDALYLALNHASNSRHAKRALVVFTDGNDTFSTFDEGELKRAARESDAIVYVVHYNERATFSGVTDPESVVADVVELSGGKVFVPSNEKQLDDTMRRITEELRSQYALGVVPAPASRKDNWHEIKVKLLARGRDEKGKVVKLNARTRKGFYWPEKGN